MAKQAMTPQQVCELVMRLHLLPDEYYQAARRLSVLRLLPFGPSHTTKKLRTYEELDCDAGRYLFRMGRTRLRAISTRNLFTLCRREEMVAHGLRLCC